MKPVSRELEKPSRRSALIAVMTIGLLCLLALLWRFLPLDTCFARENLSGISLQLKSNPLAPLYVTVFYIISGLLAFPVVILIPATAMIFGPLLGMVYSLCGLVANASVLYALGHFLGRETLYHYAGNRVKQISYKLARNGFVTVTLLRLLPIAPFFLINLIAGASPINFRTYTFATVAGISPALIIMTLAGTQLKSAWDNPVPAHLIACVLIGIILLLTGRWLTRKALKTLLR